MIYERMGFLVGTGPWSGRLIADDFTNEIGSWRFTIYVKMDGPSLNLERVSQGNKNDADNYEWRTLSWIVMIGILNSFLKSALSISYQRQLLQGWRWANRHKRLDSFRWRPKSSVVRSVFEPGGDRRLVGESGPTFNDLICRCELMARTDTAPESRRDAWLTRTLPTNMSGNPIAAPSNALSMAIAIRTGWAWVTLIVLSTLLWPWKSSRWQCHRSLSPSLISTLLMIQLPLAVRATERPQVPGRTTDNTILRAICSRAFGAEHCLLNRSSYFRCRDFSSIIPTFEAQ